MIRTNIKLLVNLPKKIISLDIGDKINASNAPFSISIENLLTNAIVKEKIIADQYISGTIFWVSLVFTSIEKTKIDKTNVENPNIVNKTSFLLNSKMRSLLAIFHMVLKGFKILDSFYHL